MKNNLQISLKLLVIAIGLFVFNQAKAQYTLDWANEYYNDNSVYLRDIASDSDNNYIVIGDLKDSVDIDLSSNNSFLYAESGALSSTFIAKYTTNGVLLWGKKISASDLRVQSFSITTDAAGNSYIGGIFRTYTSNPPPNINSTVYFTPTDSLTLGSDLAVIWILKLNSSGDFQWVKRIGITNSLGPVVGNIQLDNSGNIYISGLSGGTVNFGPPSNFTLTNFGSNRGGFLAKYNSSGVFQWAKGFTHNNPYYSFSVSFFMTSLHITSSNIFITGNYDGNPDFNPGTGVDTLGFLPIANYNTYILKLDLNGDFVSVKTLSGSNNYLGSSALDPSGNIYVTGGFTGTVDFDPSSAVNNLTSNGNFDIYIAKYTSSGSLSWVKNIGSSSGDKGRKLVLGYNGKVAVVGTFNDTVDFNPGSGINEHTANSNDAFLLFLDANGNYDTSYVWGGSGYDDCEIITKDNANNLIVAGFHSSTDMAYTGFNQVNQGGTDYAYFLLKISAPNTSSIKEQNNSGFAIFPNPATTQFTIANAEIGTRVSVIDITGKVIFTEIVNSNTHVISTKDLVNGIYFVQLENNGQISQKKLVVNK
jgi:hypothetical protein